MCNEYGVVVPVLEARDGHNVNKRFLTRNLVVRALREWVDGGRRFSEIESLHIIHQASTIFRSEWESNGFVHGNITPSTLLIDTIYGVRISGVGIAGSPGMNRRSTDEGMLAGSPYYMSPEQGMCDDQADCRADIYALGAALFHLVTGRPPYDGRNAIEIIRKHLDQELDDLQRLNPNLSPQCVSLIRHMMEKQRERRPQNWDEVIENIDRVMDGRTPITWLNGTDSTIFQDTDRQRICRREILAPEEAAQQLGAKPAKAGRISASSVPRRISASSPKAKRAKQALHRLKHRIRKDTSSVFVAFATSLAVLVLLLLGFLLQR
jgi:serine/threonine protein kinase